MYMCLIYFVLDVSLYWIECWKYYYYVYYGKIKKMERNYVCFYMCDNSLVVLSILFFDFKCFGFECWLLIW